MSRGGSGDILAGMIGSVAAQGYSLFDAACLYHFGSVAVHFEQRDH